MAANKTRYVKLCVAMVLVVAMLILGHGFYRDLSANNEETYKGLKLFSDVIELVQKNYVDDVDTQKMIEAAIQGMVRSLDPHSTLLPPDALKELQIDTHGEFTGIGIHVTMRNNLVTVISPIDSTLVEWSQVRDELGHVAVHLLPALRRTVLERKTQVAHGLIVLRGRRRWRFFPLKVLPQFCL